MKRLTLPESAPGSVPDPAGFARSASGVVDVDGAPRDVLAALLDTSRWAKWLPLHSGWVTPPPVLLEVGTSFAQHVKIMGIPAEIAWQVRELEVSRARWEGASRDGVVMSMLVEVQPASVGCRVQLEFGLDGETLRGPIGATVQRAVQEAVTTALPDLAAVVTSGVSGASARARQLAAPVLHRRSGTEIDPRTPVLVGVGQLVQREPGTDLLDPVALSAAALRRAAEDAGGTADLLAQADAVYAVASASWSYADQAALVAAAVGATPRETVVSARFGGDGGQLLVNAAAEAIAQGDADIVLVTGAEAGATLAAAHKRGISLDWPEQDPSISPSRVLGIDREANNESEAAVGLGRPVNMYALIESAVRGRRSAGVAEHDAAITGLWSRFADVAAANPYAWQPERHSPAELAAVTPANRMISTPYRKLLCANLQVDLASGLILCSAAAAEAASIDQDRWVFVHAGASGEDEWYVSERADLAASPAIRDLGAAVLAHAGIAIGDVAHIDLYACFPSAVEIAAGELGLPLDDPDRPLTVTGGLTFAGGPGNNYGTHAVANLVQRLRADPDAYGLATSLGWYLTKHALGVFSARPPAQPYRWLHPAVDLPASRPASTSYTGPAVLEAYTVTYDRSSDPQTAVLSALTPDGARVLARSTDRQLLAALLDEDPLRRPVTVTGPAVVELFAGQRQPLPEPPPSPVLIERRGPVHVITLNRPQARNAVDRRTALLLERAIDAFETDETARVAVLTGAGGAFCAGMDLKAAARGEFPFSERRGPLGLTQTPPAKPLIAAVEGPALAGGFELALAADLIVASSASQFGLPEPKRGLVAAAGGAMRVAQRLPRAVALELVMTGEPLGAARCAELGLVNRVVEPGTALSVALELAHTIAANAPLSVALGKQIVDRSADWTSAEAFTRQSEIARPALTSQDATEGMRAFVEHRAPVWTGL